MWNKANNNDDTDNGSEVDNKENNNQTNNDQTNNDLNDNTSTSSDIALNDTTDYSVWVANTTINTDQSQRSYKVIWGDTLWLISTAWKVPYQDIATYNNIPNPDLIYVDQIIYNPTFK